MMACRVVACIILMLSHIIVGFFADADDAAALLTFKNSLSNPSLLYDWKETSTPCRANTSIWVGVDCNDDGYIYRLILENMGLSGKIDFDSLALLPQLRALSFKNNSFQGPFPDHLNKLRSLKTLYLSFNEFSGVIPDDAFYGMNSLAQLHLGHNVFSGPIPSSLVPLTKLVRLSLEDNQFDGQIPDFQRHFSFFNVSNNHLTGHIPASLADISPSLFAGNDGLCGKPLPSCKSSKNKTLIIIVVVVASVVALAAILAFAYFRRGRTKTPQLSLKQLQVQGTEAHAQFAIMAPKESPDGNKGKLEFVRNDRERFELQGLLRASAEILGSSDFGPSYKAVIADGSAMVVKRFREMSDAPKSEFYDHITRLGTLSHRNLLPLVAFYYRNDEKLLISDYVENGSLATHLHGKHSSGGKKLDWPTRLKIIKGVARGLAYLHKELPSLTLPHGHLKSSNVLVDHTFEPLLTDYALAPLVNKGHAQQHMAAYKSPEFTQYARTIRKTDVWSLGILILEMLTGKFPANYERQGSSKGDLARWVNSVVREEWTGEVFDVEMSGTKNGEGEMLKLLKIGMCCCEWKVERRWDLRKAVDRIEELKERERECDEFSSNASEADIYSSRAMTDDDFSFSINA
ncbi:leucine-rich repeat transmembrane protein kinase, putative [Ricinus communis]|uniref:Leucine-rich repeat transmembrane protein kinase, putative n=1 Tax=Ricinus communis TaxID=3988 RepID=B9SPT0_RICCO|nr:leucine-rich repeat transmembrane protein kinase, putative [Ricinus communis]